MKLHKLRKGERGIRESGIGTVECKKGNRGEEEKIISKSVHYK